MTAGGDCGKGGTREQRGAQSRGSRASAQGHSERHLTILVALASCRLSLWYTHFIETKLERDSLFTNYVFT